jgi:hypothetical protein
MRELARNLWRFLCKPHGLLSWRTDTREERQLLWDLRVAHRIEKTLEAAASHGEDISDKLTDVKARIADIEARLPRGHTSAFCAFIVIYVLFVSILAAIYGDLRASTLEMWLTLDNPYLLEYRYYVSRLAKAGFFLRSSMWAGVGLLAPPVALWFAQRKLESRHAHTLATVATALVLATTCAFFGALVSVNRRPFF